MMPIEGGNYIRISDEVYFHILEGNQFIHLAVYTTMNNPSSGYLKISKGFYFKDGSKRIKAGVTFPLSAMRQFDDFLKALTEIGLWAKSLTPEQVLSLSNLELKKSHKEE